MALKYGRQQSTPMSAVDKSWLRMESSTNCMMIGVVLVFDRSVDIPRLKELIQERLLKFRRFQQRVIRRGDKCFWQDDPWFDLDNHIHRIALPGDAGKKELQELFSDLNSTHLPSDRPLWQIHHIDNYQEGCALLVRIHHCIADGIALVRVLLSLTDENIDSNVTPMPNSAPPAPPTPPSLLPRPISTLFRRAGRIKNRVEQFVDDSWRKVRRDPTYLLQLGHEAWRVGEECFNLGVQPADPPTRLRGPLCGRKQVAWAEPLSLPEVKKVARALGGTVNDVLLAAASGALQGFLAADGRPLPREGIRVAVPFNLRPLQEPINSLGNRFGLVLVPLPVDATSPRDRFTRVQQSMNQLKQSYQPQVSYGMLNAFGHGPDLLEKMAVEFLSRKASAVMTNVPGPRKPVYLCGARLVQPLFWVPQTGGIGIGLSIFSYGDKVQFGLVSDKQVLNDPEAVVQGFVSAFEALKDAAASPPGANRTETARGTAVRVAQYS